MLQLLGITKYMQTASQVIKFPFSFECSIFVKNSSAAEVRTCIASVNRTGKTTAAKGVHDHYNEYK